MDFLWFIVVLLNINQILTLGTVKDIIDYCDSNRHDIITSLPLIDHSCFIRCGDWNEDGFHYTEFEMICEVTDPSK